MNDEEQGEKAVFTFKDTMNTVMRDTTLNLKCIQSGLYEVLLKYSIGYSIRVPGEVNR